MLGDKIAEESVKGFFNLLRDWFQKKKQPPSNAFGDSLKIKEIVDVVLKRSGLSIDCFLIMLAHNGGHKLTPLTAKYRSVVAGDANQDQMRNYKPQNYVNLPIDDDYMRLLDEVIKNKNSSVGLSVDQARGSMKDKFLFEHIKFARYYYLHHSKSRADGFYYLMVGTTQPGETFEDPFHKQQLYFAITKIKNIIKEYK